MHVRDAHPPRNALERTLATNTETSLQKLKHSRWRLESSTISCSVLEMKGSVSFHPPRMRGTKEGTAGSLCSTRDEVMQWLMHFF